MLKQLIPQKRVAAELGVSRSSLWRARRSAIDGFPAPVVLATRVYWQRADLPALKAALAHFAGRRGFEAQQRYAKARAARAHTAAVKIKRRKRAPGQPALFGDASGAAKLTSG